MQDQAIDLRTRLLRSRRTAMLVIHGIGEQNPYETLDNFARHLSDLFASECGFRPEISPEKIEHDDWVEVCIHLTSPDRGPEHQKAEIDLYEYYWAPCTEGKASYREVLRWLAITTLRPLQFLALNLEVESDDGREGAALVFFKELIRICCLYLPLLVAILYGTLWYSSDKVPSLQSLKQGLSTWVGAPHALGILIMLALFAMTLYLVIFAFTFLVKALARQPSIEPRAERVWSGLAFLAALAFLVAGWFTGRLAGFVSLYQQYRVVSDTVLDLLVLVPLLLAGMWIYFLQYFLGDVAVYVSSDEKSKNYAARVGILNGSTLALTRLLKAKTTVGGTQQYKYDSVILVGHSLGSVIAYDTVDELLNASGASPDQLTPKLANLQITMADLEKLTGLVTFGSPLDKIYYFFREHVAADQAVRAQILSYLHSFRKVRSRRKYGDYKFTYVTCNLPNLTWLNAWSIMDPVSGKLRFYMPDHRRHFFYWIPLAAHLSYWKDKKFYRFVAEHLLF